MRVFREPPKSCCFPLGFPLNPQKRGYPHQKAHPMWKLAGRCVVGLRQRHATHVVFKRGSIKPSLSLRYQSQTLGASGTQQVLPRPASLQDRQRLAVSIYGLGRDIGRRLFDDPNHGCKTNRLQVSMRPGTPVSGPILLFSGHLFLWMLKGHQKVKPQFSGGPPK